MTADESPTVICLTPVRNESWILERFRPGASMWADHIVIADQRRTTAPVRSQKVTRRSR